VRPVRAAADEAAAAVRARPVPLVALAESRRTFQRTCSHPARLLRRT
jgi:hypothetical protein